MYPHQYTQDTRPPNSQIRTGVRSEVPSPAQRRRAVLSGDLGRAVYRGVIDDDDFPEFSPGVFSRSINGLPNDRFFIVSANDERDVHILGDTPFSETDSCGRQHGIIIPSLHSGGPQGIES